MSWVGISIAVMAPVAASRATAEVSPSPDAIAIRPLSPAVPHPGKEQAANVPGSPGEPEPRSLSMFFAIGIVINLLMLVVVSVWAYRELRRLRKPRQP